MVATNATLTISNVSFASAGFYSVLVTNLYGQRFSATADLVVQSQPLIVCGTNRTIDLETPWNFDVPRTFGDEVS
jgi:hypothetical protein